MGRATVTRREHMISSIQPLTCLENVKHVTVDLDRRPVVLLKGTHAAHHNVRPLRIMTFASNTAGYTVPKVFHGDLLVGIKSFVDSSQ